ncbi:XdhC family protein [Dechloromonas sp. XY25]|uniref:XdhC family protein n=1 Tax=Dechloromonas hankyongensis TaxID=2908002 RepID=A0ABS9JYB9_9RHOO|nr:XdhC family protein [Dechloromonas hankyongensis]MCG2575898.1 XdhC family protein [Dechloromonas hankyongensis]
MDNLDTQVLDAARRWAADGHRFALVTVARTWGSAPRPPGAWMAIRDDGRVQGSVSGGCIEDDLIDRMAAGEFAGPAMQVVRYGVTADEAHRFGLPCGGTLELVVEPAPEIALLDTMAGRIAAGQLVERRLDMTANRVSIAGGQCGAQLSWNGSLLVTQHGPAWRLLIIGAGQISRFLANMAQQLGYRVVVCDPREEYGTEWDVPGADLLTCMPDDAVLELALDPHSAVVALTHDPKLDDLVLLEALKSPAFYVGALGSKANTAKRRERLHQYFDLSQAELDRLHGPVGLPIGSRTPPEIAVSILAEMTAVKNAAMARESAAEAVADPLACRA